MKNKNRKKSINLLPENSLNSLKRLIYYIN